VKILQLAAGLIASLTVFGVTASAQARPALTQDIDQPGRNVFSLRADVFDGGSTTFTVPAGKRYVIDRYTGDCATPNTTSLIDITVVTEVTGTNGFYRTPVHYTENVGFGLVRYGGSGEGPIYADPGTTIELSATVASAQSTDYRGCTFVISGHVINNP
jgi:hypothetical protein